MSSWIQQVMDWSEVWAGILPCIIVIRAKQPANLKPVVWYVWLSLLINVGIDLIWKLRDWIPHAYHSNNFLYNLLSIIRFYLFALFFLSIARSMMKQVTKAFIWIFSDLLVINFTFCEDFFNFNHFSSRLLSAEALFLLFFVLQYYLIELQKDEAIDIFTNRFWIVTGLGIYVSVNFFVFLLYNTLSQQSQRFAVNLWNLHNISFVLFNIFLVKGLLCGKKTLI